MKVNCVLFIHKTCSYRIVKDKFPLVILFKGISTLMGYLMLNPVYRYIFST